MSDVLSDEQIAELIRWASDEASDEDSGDSSWFEMLAALRELQQRRALAALPAQQAHTCADCGSTLGMVPICKRCDKAQQASAQPDVAHEPTWWECATCTAIRLKRGGVEAVRHRFSDRCPAGGIAPLLARVPAPVQSLEQIVRLSFEAGTTNGFGHGKETYIREYVAALQRSQETGDK